MREGGPAIITAVGAGLVGNEEAWLDTACGWCELSRVEEEEDDDDEIAKDDIGKDDIEEADAHEEEDDADEVETTAWPDEDEM
jgi:hypothetical protein